jgi:hypothetical protein
MNTFGWPHSVCYSRVYIFHNYILVLVLELVVFMEIQLLVDLEEFMAHLVSMDQVLVA